MNKFELTSSDNLVVVFFTLPFVLVNFLIKGYVISHLWNWFAMPLTGINIGLVHAVGISALIIALSGWKYKKIEPKSYNGRTDFYINFFTELLFHPLMYISFLCYGYIIHCLM